MAPSDRSSSETSSSSSGSDDEHPMSKRVALRIAEDAAASTTVAAAAGGRVAQRQSPGDTSQRSSRESGELSEGELPEVAPAQTRAAIGANAHNSPALKGEVIAAAKRRKASPAEQQGRGTPAAQPLLGVVLVEEGVEGPTSLQRVRAPRYFDDDFESNAGGRRCYKCGEVGHIARDCDNEVVLRPCWLCAQLGHTRGECPNTLCFKCNRAGHQARECTAHVSARPDTCLRCGSGYCAAAGEADYVRAAGSCSDEYCAQDLARVRCYVCGISGHLCCAGAGAVGVPKPTCFNCGEGGHVGAECWREASGVVKAERYADRSRQRGGGYGGGYGGRSQSGSCGNGWSQGGYYSQHDNRGSGRYDDRFYSAEGYGGRKRPRW